LSLYATMAYGHNPAKVPNFKIGHDGILSIGNFILMIKNHILLFQLPDIDQHPKNVLPISVATWNFLFIWLLVSYRASVKVKYMIFYHQHEISDRYITIMPYFENLGLWPL
jgi:hypothetical protein